MLLLGLMNRNGTMLITTLKLANKVKEALLVANHFFINFEKGSVARYSNTLKRHWWF